MPIFKNIKFLRMGNRSGFQTGRRYEATDGLLPRWAAVYELDDIAFLDSPEYMALIHNRSDRERRVLSRLDVLDRHVYRLVCTKGLLNERANDAKTVLLTVHLTCHPSAAMHIEKWYDEVSFFFWFWGEGLVTLHSALRNTLMH